MPASTLTITHEDIQKSLGMYLGWSINPGSWSANETAQAEIIIAKGIRQVYNPPILPGEHSQHEWTFLTPVRIFETQSDVADYDLPEDFAGLADDITFKSETQGYYPLRIVSDVEIRKRRQGVANLSGYPEMAAVLPLPADGTQPQRWSLMLYPTPDGAYEMEYRYHSDPNNVSAGTPYPLGGLPLADVIMASVIAAAELELNDAPGPRMEDFLMKLRAAVSLDRRRNVQSLGYCADPSTDVPRFYAQDTRLIYNDTEL